ncbi:MAG: xanthine dehydrogenase family protein molybdopterin-binding subunit [Thermoplasmatales archaeon]
MMNSQELFSAEKYLVIGQDVQRVDALDKALGKPIYTADQPPAGTLYARVVKSNVSHGLIKQIKYDHAKSVEGFVDLITAADVPGINEIGYYVDDQPAICGREVKFKGEVLGLVVAKTEKAAEEARALVNAEIEELPAVFDIFDAFENKVLARIDKTTNTLKTVKVRLGDVEKGFKSAKVIVEGTYKTGYQDHVYLESDAALAIPMGDEITVITANQNPHHVQQKVARVLGIPMSKVKIITPIYGGSFGGKNDMGPILAAQVSIAAWKVGVPVLLEYTMEDAFTSHGKRDPSIIKFKTGAAENGLLTAVEAEIIFDSGGYANRSPYTIVRGALQAMGPYKVPNVKINGYAVYTNKVFEGGFRGFGNPQTQFATERQMDKLANKLNMDPVELRLANLLRKGDMTGTGQLLENEVGVGEALSKAAEKSGWYSKPHRWKLEDGKIGGLGVAVAWHGFGTSYLSREYADALVTISRDGSVNVYSGIVEMGQGSSTALAQIASETLGVPMEYIKVQVGSSEYPFTGATAGSRGASICGAAVYVASKKLKERIVKFVSDKYSINPTKIDIKDKKIITHNGLTFDWEKVIQESYSAGVEMSAKGYYVPPQGTYDFETGRGAPFLDYAYLALVVEVEVDTNTGITRVTNAWPALCAGKVINPSLVNGQLYGSIAMGLGYALMEELKIENGEIKNPNLTDYLIPTMSDMPKIEDPILVEDIYPYGAYGSKGIAEATVIPVAPAIANAISEATSMDVDEIPITQEKLYFALRR